MLQARLSLRKRAPERHSDPRSTAGLLQQASADVQEAIAADELRTWAWEAPCYLYSLRPKVPMAELAERAATLEEAWERARIEVTREEWPLQAVGSAVAPVTETAPNSQVE